MEKKKGIIRNNVPQVDDALDRLGTATGWWGSLGWTYDGVGNRQTENSNAYTYYANTNRLNTANGVSFGYDNNGNTTTEGGRQYIYNQNQRLIQVNNGGTTAYYTYNGNGQRVKKNVNGTITIFHYNTHGQIIAESNSGGTITAEYVYLNGQPLAKLEGASTYYYHNDHLGTPQKMTDASGVVVWAADYKPFGEATITVSTITNNLRFPGQYYDAETGLHYNYFRDYNPALGRYVEKDILGLKGGINLYRYVGNNPLLWSDPLGLFPYHGFYCGPNWTAGMPVSWDQMSEYDQKNAIKPRDPMDACCKTHDEGYGNCREKCKGLCGEKKEQCEKDCFNERDRQINQCLWNADTTNIGDATKKLGAEIIFILQPAIRNGGYNGETYYQLQFRF